MLIRRISQPTYSSFIVDIANWINHLSSNISVTGMFFDDVNNTAADAVSQHMSNLSAYAYTNVPSAVKPVVVNLGALVPVQLLDYCDTIVEYESPFSIFENNTTIENTVPRQYRAQSGIIAYSTPVSANAKSLAHRMANYSIRVVYLGAHCG